jgi:hypothetical protein
MRASFVLMTEDAAKKTFTPLGARKSSKISSLILRVAPRRSSLISEGKTPPLKATSPLK